MRVKRLPVLLALHLKRFKYSENANRFIKLSYYVPFPQELRLFNTVSKVSFSLRIITSSKLYHFALAFIN